MYPLSLIVTLILIYIVFLFIMFLVYFKYMHGIVLVTFEFIYEFIERLIQYSSELSSLVSMVLRHSFACGYLYSETW
jgi:hypothetical protein